MEKSFKQLVQDIADSGMNETQIAAEVGCSQSNISYIMSKDHEPRYFLGANIIALHKKRCGRKAKK